MSARLRCNARGAQDRSAFQGKRVLITGGFGFIGGHIAAVLPGRGARVTILDRECSAERESIINLKNGLRQHVDVVEGSVLDLPLLSLLMTDLKPDFVFHAAACATIEVAARDPIEAIRTNALGLVTVLEAVRRAGLRAPVVTTSTDKVYGELSHRHNDPYELELGCNEGTPLRGIGIYDSAKLASDVLGQTYSRCYGARCTVVRLCNTFGPYDFNYGFRVIPKSAAQVFGAAEPRPPVLYAGSIEHHRDYLYIDDMVELLLLVAATPACHGHVYNAFGCTYLSTADVVRTIVDVALEIEADPQVVARIAANGIKIERNADPSVAVCSGQHLNGEKIRAATGFTPQVSFEEGLWTTLAFYRHHFRNQRNIRRTLSTTEIPTGTS